MEGVCLEFYVNEFEKYQGRLTYEWILDFVKKNGVQGCSVFKSIAGYGRHRKVHEEHFFELASETSIKIEIFLPRQEAERLIEVLKTEDLNLFYSILSSEFGVINGRKD